MKRWQGGQRASKRAIDLLNVIEDKFTPFGDWRKLIDKWRRLRQGESYTAYRAFVERLQAIYPLGKRIDPRFALVGMKEGLQVDVLCRLDQEGVVEPTLTQILDWGEQLAPKHAAGRTEHGSAMLSAMTTQKESTTATVGASPTKLSRSCFVCGKTGHMAYKCDDRWKKGCYKCGDSNHGIKDCPQVQGMKQKLAQASPVVLALLDGFLECQQEFQLQVCTGGETETAGKVEELEIEEMEDEGETDEVKEECLGELVAVTAQANAVGWLKRLGITAERLLVYQVHTKGGGITVLVDPGAQVSVMRRREAERRGFELTPTKQESGGLKAAGNQQQAITHIVKNFRFWVGGWSDTHSVLVADELLYPVLLGMDWVRKHVPLIDWVTGEMRIGGCHHVWRLKGTARVRDTTPESKTAGIEWEDEPRELEANSRARYGPRCGRGLALV